MRATYAVLNYWNRGNPKIKKTLRLQKIISLLLTIIVGMAISLAKLQVSSSKKILI